MFYFETEPIFYGITKWNNPMEFKGRNTHFKGKGFSKQLKVKIFLKGKQQTPKGKHDTPMEHSR
jgi:hypothetical protein